MSEDFNLNDFEHFDPDPLNPGMIVATKEDGTKEGISENLILNRQEHQPLEKSEYDDLYQRAKESTPRHRKNLEKAIADAIFDLEGGKAPDKDPAKKKPDAKTPPEPKPAKPKTGEKVGGKEIDRTDFPKKAEWTPTSDPKHEVEVLGVYKEKIDGKTSYQISSKELPGMEAHPIPKSELKFEDKEKDGKDERVFEVKDGVLTYKMEVKKGDKVVVQTEEGDFETDWVVTDFGKTAEGVDTLKVEKKYIRGDATVTKTREEPVAMFMKWHTETGFVDDEEPVELGEGDDPPGGPEESKTTKETLDKAKKDLKEVRTNLIEVTIRRRARAGDGLTKSRKEDAELYDQLMAKYKDRLSKYIQAVEGDSKAEGLSDEEVQNKVVMAEFAEMRKMLTVEFKMSNRAVDNMDKDAKDKNIFARTYAKRGKFLRKWANLPTWAKVSSGLVIGAGVGLASGGLGLGLAGLAVGSASKVSLGLVNRKANILNVSKHQFDKEIAKLKQLEKRRIMTMMADGDLEEMRTGAVDETEAMWNKRVAWAQKRNKIGNYIMLASGLVGAYGVAEMAGAPGVGEMLSDGIHDVTNPIGGLFHHGLASHGAENIGSGSSGHVGSSGAENISPADGPSVSGGSSHGMEGLYYHGSGHEAAVRLPGNMHLGQLNGHDAILDNHGNTVFSDPKNGIWNNQGRLTSSAIKHLRILNYRFSEGQNFYDPNTDKWHYFTEVRS